MKAACVTGATGLLGSALVRELMGENVRVYAVVRKNSPNMHRLGGLHGLELVECDLKDYDALAGLLPAGMDVFYHLAWDGTGPAARNDYAVQISNIGASMQALEAAVKLGIPKYIFAGSLFEREAERAGQSADSLPGGLIYKMSKLAADRMSLAYAKGRDIDYVSSLVTNIYGAGELSGRLVCQTIKKLLLGQETSFSDGEQLYDFIYVTDAARAFRLLGEKTVGGGQYVVGSGSPGSLKSYVEQIGEIVAPGRDMGIGRLPKPVELMQKSDFDISPLSKSIGYKPEVEFPEGIRRTADWLKAQLGENGAAIAPKLTMGEGSLK